MLKRLHACVQTLHGVCRLQTATSIRGNRDRLQRQALGCVHVRVYVRDGCVCTAEPEMGKVHLSVSMYGRSIIVQIACNLRVV